jgi:serine/threonine-protein kinase
MHKHLKSPLKPPDHINTALSAGVGEIIEVAMAKNREDRYAHTEDLLEDIRLVQAGKPPIHAKKSVDLDSLQTLEETGKTVDIAPTGTATLSLWSQPMFVVAIIVAGVSLLANIILLVLVMK